MTRSIMIRKYHRATSDEKYSNDYTEYQNLQEIIKQFGKKNCLRRGKKLYVFTEENLILMYQYKEEENKTKKRRG